MTRASLLGVAVGISYATDAALLKTCSDRLQSGLMTVFASWQLYAVVIVGAAGLFLCQLAYEAGPRHASPQSRPSTPLASVFIGVLLLLFVLVCGLAVSLVGLARVAASLEPDEKRSGWQDGGMTLPVAFGRRIPSRLSVLALALVGSAAIIWVGRMDRIGQRRSFEPGSAATLVSGLGTMLGMAGTPCRGIQFCIRSRPRFWAPA